MRKGTLLLAVLFALLAAGFAWQNRGETTAVHLGIFHFYQVPVSWIALGSLLLGMIAMFVLGLGHDLRVRRRLREHERAATLRSPVEVR